MHGMSHDGDQASTFRLFITPTVENIILEMTNREGHRKYGGEWRGMDETDLRAYVGLLILAGVYRSRGEAVTSLWDTESGRAIFRATMPLKLFQTPPFRQYMPSKPAKYGFKSWVACDAKSSYTWKMQVYTRKPSGRRPERRQGLRVVLNVTEGLHGRNVTCDNYFTSYELARQLLERKITVVGTVRKNKPELLTGLLAVHNIPRRLFLQRLDMERDPPWLDAGQAEQAEGVPRGAGKGSRDSSPRSSSPARGE